MALQPKAELEAQGVNVSRAANEAPVQRCYCRCNHTFGVHDPDGSNGERGRCRVMECPCRQRSLWFTLRKVRAGTLLPWKKP